MNELELLGPKSLETKNFSELTKDFEKISSVMNSCRAIAYKIINTIESKKLWQKEEYYTKPQLDSLKDKGINAPWDYALRDVLENLYDFFSWKSYARYGQVLSKIDVNLASRLTEDALGRLNRSRDNIHTIVPALINLKKDIITELDIYEIVDAHVKKKPKILPRSSDIKIQPISKDILEQGELVSAKAKNKTISNAYKELLTLCKALEKENSDLTKRVVVYKEENQELTRELRVAQNELKNKR